MLVSTKGRYALRYLVDLAQHEEEGFIPLKESAERQGISPKYLERIVLILTQTHLIESFHGKKGGYRLRRKPESYTALEILEAIEGDLAPVACLERGAAPCPRSAICPTLGMWKGFQEITRSYFASISLADLLKDPSAQSSLV